MFNSKPHIIYKAICIWLILILLISGLNFILITSSHENLDQRQQTNQTDLTSHKDQTEQSITNKNIGENEERSDLKESKTVLAISNSISTITNHNHASDDDIVQISSDEVLLSNSNKNTDDTEKSRSRANDIFNYDLRISSTISLNYSGFFGWQFPGMNYPFRIVGEVGRPSVFSITIENIGKRFVGHENNAYLTINLTDYLGYSNWEQRDYIGPISPQDKYTMNFTWTPTYSNRFNLTCNLSFQNDQNTSNNIINFYNFLVKKWTDDFEDGDINDWSGDIGLGAWHTTNTIQGDPNPDAHTSPYALYHGIETGFEDDYGEKNDFEIITPELDLRRFEKNRLAFLNFNFYGDSTSELDKFSIAVKKTSDSIWEEINNYEYSGATVNSSNAPEWKTWIYPPINPIYIGIPIHDFVGEIIQFRIHWESDQTPEQKKGFYFDDFFIYGYERPIPDFDLGIDYVMVEPIDEPIVAGGEFRIFASLTNYGVKEVSNIDLDISIKDFSGRMENNILPNNQTITKLEHNESKLVSWKIFPSVSGIYYINISIDFDKDMVTENNFIATEVVEVLKFYDSFETLDGAEDWIFDPGWVRKEVVNDEFPKQHSRTHAWFISNSGENQTNQNSSNILYSPIIDLEGAQTNELYKNDQIKIDFKWYGNGNPGDKLYFEYTIDHSDNWKLFTLPLGESSIITGNALDSWHSWANLGTTELFGHDVQFRWRFKSNSESGDDIGYYIDDFSVWVVQEEYGRPEITDINAFPNSLINDGQDEIEISCRIISRTWGMEEVFINFEPVGGLIKQQLNNIFFDFIDVFLGYWGGDYNINLTVPPNVPENDYILQITAVDLNGRTDHSYVKITVKENSAPDILEYYPGNSTISIFESEMIDFSVKAYDAEDGYDLDYNWYLNSNKIANLNNNFYLFKTDYHGNISAGRHILEVIISDNGLPSKSVQFEWIIDVLEVLPDFEIREKEIELTTGNVTVNEIIELVVPIHNLRPPPERNVTVHLIQQSTNISIGETVYNTYKIDILFGNYKEILTLTWRGNTSYQYLKVWVDPNNNITEIFEENNYAIIPVNVSQPPIIIEDKPKNDNNSKQNQIPYLFYIITGSVIFSLLILFITVSTEIGNYRLFLLFAPLYSRVTGDKILEHQLRLKIYSYIRAHPGDHYRSIMAKLKIKNGTLVHHLSRLEQEELIKSERDGYFKRFYPVGMRIPKSDVGMYYPEGIATYNIGEHQVSAIQLRILKTIKKEPGLTQKEISQRIKESRRVVNYHVKLLEQHELIKILKNGRETQCYIRDKSSEISG